MAAKVQFDRYENLQKFNDSILWSVCCCCCTGTMTKILLKGRVAPKRSKFDKTPKDVGINYKEVSWSALDGIKIAAWEMIDPAHTKVVLINNPILVTMGGSNEGFEKVPVNFLPMMKKLWDAGYDIVTYDHRAQGASEGGLEAYGTKVGEKEAPCGVGSEEWKDVIGGLDYIAKHDELGKKDLVLLGQCMGSTAMLGVYERDPSKMERVKGFLINMPPIGYNMTARITSLMLKKNLIDVVEQAQWDQYKIKIANPLLGIANVKCPMIMFQYKEERYTYNPETKKNDAQLIYDACPSTDKQIIYNGPGTDNEPGYTKRFDAYRYLGDHPEAMIAFFDKVTSK